jgi:hypothetical protein
MRFSKLALAGLVLLIALSGSGARADFLVGPWPTCSRAENVNRTEEARAREDWEEV